MKRSRTNPHILAVEDRLCLIIFFLIEHGMKIPDIAKNIYRRTETVDKYIHRINSCKKKANKIYMAIKKKND